MQRDIIQLSVTYQRDYHVHFFSSYQVSFFSELDCVAVIFNHNNDLTYRVLITMKKWVSNVKITLDYNKDDCEIVTYISARLKVFLI